ncbi:hypothetical protein EIN_052100 [Entamoeba invadens IP1]|uniref:hypothetical protein n=1 Tax=Entamoeba invadens IP1 TaxID=370355 RepID=UPI0002C3D25A|nr:hypothetical protein EIN_052100 [Entamoeba invadens IP1]ELP93015.1 hypothetical protein EIN_052100 [Entamoeba invadens IP1]|eukprot:XP_004259786.1 hypothetical protein EIN_052100 [Entamoeba invadens IP1]
MEKINNIITTTPTEKLLTTLRPHNRLDVLVCLYTQKKFSFFFSLLLESEVTTVVEHLLISVCSLQIETEQIIRLFTVLLGRNVEIQVILKSVQIGAYKNAEPRKQHTELLKLFHIAHRQATDASLLFHENFTELQKVITAAPKKNWIQTQAYPTVTVNGTCVICKAPLFDGQSVTVLPCGHGIHAACADYMNDSSPVCRKCLSEQAYPLIA